MIVDGERLKALFRDAQREVLLCTPFIKARVLKTLLSTVEASVFVRVVTRWRAREVAAGVSDLAVFEIANNRPNTELALLNDLHAKLYLADDSGLVGSVNLTATALGWAERTNIEILMAVRRENPDVERLLKRLDTAVQATFAIRSAVEVEAATLTVPKLDESQDFAKESDDGRKWAWFPRCAAPDKLHAMYVNSETAAVVEGTRGDGLADLHDLHTPSGMSAADFANAVQETLLLMPAFKRIIDRVPQGVTDADGIGLVIEERPDLTQPDAAHQWRIIRDWIAVFFEDQFEVAPESFVTRLRPRYRGEVEDPS